MNMRKKRRRKTKAALEFTSEVEWKEPPEGSPMMVGYVRVSTDGQDTQRQVDELVRAGVHVWEIGRAHV